MIIEEIRKLKPGTVIPKPKSTSEFRIKSWGKRRGEDALTYWVPNHKNPAKPLVKGITVLEFSRAYEQLLQDARLTRKWFNVNLEACAREGPCNFTTIGGIFQLLGVAHYDRSGTYVLNKVKAEGSLDRLDFEAMFDEIAAEALEAQSSATANRSVLEEVMDPLDEERKARFRAAIDGLGRLFGPKKATDES